MFLKQYCWTKVNREIFKYLYSNRHSFTSTVITLIISIIYIYTAGPTVLNFFADSHGFQANRLSLNVSKTKYIVFRNRNMHFDPKSCNISIGNEMLERIGNDCVSKYFKGIEFFDANLNFRIPISVNRMD